ncbi:MAG: hypothetical protein M1834_002996 [Cirrosporium novae-zelandiae]|nr:MAG: hypothetical protein M1834_002996 [Cirrosporium novae-zelandiae]
MTKVLSQCAQRPLALCQRNLYNLTLRCQAKPISTLALSLHDASYHPPFQAINLKNNRSSVSIRTFSLTSIPRSGESSQAQTATDLNQQGQEEQESQLDTAIDQQKERQIRRPWQREGSNIPPVARQRSAGAMTKGKLLTTPSRLLKLIIPLTTLDKNSDRKDVEPLALVVHPQQPLSYLERLIQAELPTIKNDKGEDKIPSVHFQAEDSQQDELRPKKRIPEEDKDSQDTTEIEGKSEPTGRLNRRTPQEAANLRGGPGEGGVESYSGLGHERTKNNKKPFVRWSSSTEIGDFIRDAARGKEFAVKIEGARNEIRIGVPSFNDRTYYLRMRLRKLSQKISSMAALKRECDDAAHRRAQRFAMGGFGGLISWWFVVWALTFQTDLGWDTMEPVTYLVGLSAIIGGYMWFLAHNREISYRSAMNYTVSRTQNKLYEAKGLSIAKWESLIEEGNALRREIKAVANEYDVDWDEQADEKDETVKEALKNERDKNKNSGEEEDNDGKGKSGNKQNEE